MSVGSEETLCESRFSRNSRIWERIQDVNQLRHRGILLWSDNEVKVFAVEPLGNHQLTAALLFERHSVVEGNDGTLRLLIGGRFRGNPLQPQSRGSHQSKKRSSMFRGEANNLVRHSGDQRKKNNARGKSSSKRCKWNQHVKTDGNQHHSHQEAGPASRMEGRILLNRGNLERISVLKRKNRLVLGAVVFVDTPDVFPKRHSPNEQQEQNQANRPVDQIENDLPTKGRIQFFQLGSRHKRQVLVHENEESQRKQNVRGGEPAADGRRFLSRFRLRGLFRRYGGRIRNRTRYALVLHDVFNRDIRRKPQCAVSQLHRITQGDHTPHNGPCHPFVLLRRTFQGFTHGDHLTRRFATSDRPRVWRPHHDALEHGLAPDQSLFATF